MTVAGCPFWLGVCISHDAHTGRADSLGVRKHRRVEHTRSNFNASVIEVQVPDFECRGATLEVLHALLNQGYLFVGLEGSDWTRE